MSYPGKVELFLSRGNNRPATGILPDMTTARLGLLASIGFAFLTGCAATPQAQAPRAPVTTPPIEVAAVVVSPFSDLELEQQFEQARALLLNEKYREAADRFDKLVRLAPEGETAPPSLYNGALAHEGLGERLPAVESYRKLIERFPEHPTTRGAYVRLSRLYSYLERWNERRRLQLDRN